MKRWIGMAAALVLSLGMTGCGAGKEQKPAAEQTEAVTADLEEIRQAVQDAYGESYIPSAPYDAETFAALFGITEDMYETYVAEGPMISVHVDTFAAVEAKEGQADAVEQAFADYREAQLTQAAQYPMNLPKIEASQVVRHGNYVFVVMLGTPSAEAEMEGEEAALESAREQNQIAVDVIDSFFS